MARLIKLCLAVLFVLWPGIVLSGINEMGTTSVASIDEAGTTAIASIDEAGTTTVTLSDDCSGSLMFGWHFESTTVTSGTPAGCSDGDTTAASTGSPSLSTGQVYDGTYSLYVDALNEDYHFTVSSNDLIDLDSIKITFNIYIVSYPTTPTYDFEFLGAYYTDWQNQLSMRIHNNGTVVVYRAAQGGASASVAVTVSTGSWVSCEYQAKTGVAGNDHYLDCGGTPDEDDDDHATKDASANLLWFGDIAGSEASEYYLDNVKIYPSDY